MEEEELHTYVQILKGRGHDLKNILESRKAQLTASDVEQNQLKRLLASRSADMGFRAMLHAKLDYIALINRCMILQ